MPQHMQLRAHAHGCTATGRGQDQFTYICERSRPGVSRARTISPQAPLTALADALAHGNARAQRRYLFDSGHVPHHHRYLNLSCAGPGKQPLVVRPDNDGNDCDAHLSNDDCGLSVRPAGILRLVLFPARFTNRSGHPSSLRAGAVLLPDCRYVPASLSSCASHRM